MLKTLWRRFDLGWQTLRLMGSVNTSHRRISYELICNNVLFDIFIGKLKVYEYNRVLRVLMWYLRVLMYRCMYWLVCYIFKM